MVSVSVVIPLYNKENHIRTTIDSVLAQEVQDFEIVVVNDGSTDKSGDIVKSYLDPRIRLVQQANSGVSAARNRGIKESKADLIAFLDADDEWLPSFLKTILDLRQKYPSAGAYITAYHKLTSKGEWISPKYIAIPTGVRDCVLPNYFRSATLGSFPVRSSNVVIPKYVFNLVGLFPKGRWWGEDSDMWGRIALEYPVAFSWDAQVIIHHDNDKKCKYKPIEKHPFVETAITKINNKEVSKNILDDLKEYISREEISTAVLILENGNHKKARELLFKCKTKTLKNSRNTYILLSFLPHNVYRILRYDIYQYLRKRKMISLGR